jgi:alpha-mannosidase
MQRCDFSLPSAQSLIGVSGKNVVVAVVKMPEDEWTLSGEVIVRVLETAGRPAQCELTLPFSVVKAVETDHLEETVLGEAQADGNKVIVGLEPGELKTLKLHHAGLIPSTAGRPPT